MADPNGKIPEMAGQVNQARPRHRDLKPCQEGVTREDLRSEQARWNELLSSVPLFPSWVLWSFALRIWLKARLLQ